MLSAAECSNYGRGRGVQHGLKFSRPCLSTLIKGDVLQSCHPHVCIINFIHLLRCADSLLFRKKPGNAVLWCGVLRCLLLCWLCTADYAPLLSVSFRHVAAQVMPYVSLCAQKAAYLEKLLAPLNRTVKAMYGGLGGTSITPGETGVLAARKNWQSAMSCLCNQ